MTVAQHRGLRRDHLPDRIERLLGTALLYEADDGVHQHDEGDDGRIHDMAEKGCGHRRRQQEIVQRTVELAQEAQQLARARGFGQGVGAVADQPGGSLRRAQPL